ncbi:hypothetical protein EHQ47_16645 [Leptospira bourretii]|uniref:hypothetical protein n=1 Tax=Leptospira bourretii TaxID=2484962 RepID=UPI001090C050|nr:hypothetical protein [Leptospira bourretii]TGL19725.1 hypothetical protein EHQ47_16645 [Leptospira bourretii]
MNKTRISLLLIFTLSCTQNSSLKNDTLISQADADAEFSLIVYAKQLEYFPSHTYFDMAATIDGDFGWCKRSIQYDKSDFRYCMSRISATYFPQKHPFEIYHAIKGFVTENCKLRKIILFKDSLIKGELNACSVHKW